MPRDDAAEATTWAVVAIGGTVQQGLQVGQEVAPFLLMPLHHAATGRQPLGGDGAGAE